MIDKHAATTIIRDTFEKSFDKGRFVHFVRNLLNKIDESKAFHVQGAYIPESFRDYVKTYERLGSYADPEGNKIDLLIVYLQKETSLERARTAQRNFVARYLKDRGEKEAGLVAFVSPEPEDWRFSFVKMEYRLEETPQGKTKVKEELTPARRYSFLVGANESSHTAKNQFLPILQDDKNDPTLSALEKAFSIEVVTREFFGKYRELFLKIKEALEGIVAKDNKIREDFAAKGVNTVDFSKKLLGQIVFLYFLQKKGWFGVARDAAWGSGSKQFLRELFDGKHSTYKNFFNDILEPLFYEALRIDRSHDDDYYSKFNCKIPFLNGGLFDPINNYDWVHTDILIPNKLFSNSEKTREGDTGTGILDVFDRYNFTVWEDEPLEKEVAVDPEMLGKVFENLLEVKDRKSRGTYYTPREIVHYMCQESLINYLDTAVNTGAAPLRQAGTPQGKLIGERWSAQMALSAPAYQPVVPRQDIEILVRRGELALEHDSRVESHGKETERYPYKISQSIRQNAMLIDEKLDNIRVCDPAVGSGAFLVGMMHEIVRCRKVLTTYLGEDSRSVYDFKRHAIQSCLYGVDIDPGAVEIAKLRLWLSLVVDEEDIRQIKPLPNLDYKIVCGNSLLGVGKDILNWPLFEELEKLKPIYFDETNARKKQEFRNQIDRLIKKLTNNNETFDFEVYFSEVFHEKGGFDVVIANPPYAKVQTLQQSQPQNISFFRENYISAKGNFDIYVIFMEKGFMLLNLNGIFSYILPHKFFQSQFGKAIRELIARNKSIFQIVRFGAEQVFNESTTYTCLLFLSKKTHNDLHLFEVKSLENPGGILGAIQANMPHSDYKYAVIKAPTGAEWNFLTGDANKVLQKLRQQSHTLGDITRKIFVGLQTSADKVYVLGLISMNEATARCFSSALQREVDIERGLIKPFLMGKDVHRYEPLKPKNVVIFPYTIKNGEADLMPPSFIREHFPNGWKYLMENKKALSEREKGLISGPSFYAYGRPQNLVEFEAVKLVTPDICIGPQMSIDETASLYHTTTLYSFSFAGNIKDSPKYILGILDSKIMSFFLRSTGTVLRGGYLRFKTEYLKPFPIPCSVAKSPPSKAQHDAIVELVNQILAIKRANPAADVSALERQIDQLVYQLYGLTPEEIAVVEGSVRG